MDSIAGAASTSNNGMIFRPSSILRSMSVGAAEPSKSTANHNNRNHHHNNSHKPAKVDSGFGTPTAGPGSATPTVQFKPHPFTAVVMNNNNNSTTIPTPPSLEALHNQTETSTSGKFKNGRQRQYGAKHHSNTTGIPPDSSASVAGANGGRESPDDDINSNNNQAAAAAAAEDTPNSNSNNNNSKSEQQSSRTSLCSSGYGGDDPFLPGRLPVVNPFDGLDLSCTSIDDINSIDNIYSLLAEMHERRYGPDYASDPESRERKFSLSNPPMPWFGIDIGGTLVKLVYFEPTDQEDWPEGTAEAEKTTTKNIQKYLTDNVAYGESGIRDADLELSDVRGRFGKLHFIRFPSSQTEGFLQLAQRKGMTTVSSTVCATGGGATKFQETFEEMKLQFFKFDELESVINGLEYLYSSNSEGECFYWDNPLSDQPVLKKWSCPGNKIPYPFLVVNIGSGISILSVRGPRKFTRVGGSSLGGGFFFGLCSLLTGCVTFEEALELASLGDNTKVDKLVQDIYGGDYDVFGLPGDTVAASFAHMIDPERRKNASKADLCKAVLVSVTNNIASIARLCAKNEGIEKVIFVGNFLRVNNIASKRLSFSMDYWSKGQMKALFMMHEGYFGAIGCMLELARLSETKRQMRERAEIQLKMDLLRVQSTE